MSRRKADEVRLIGWRLEVHDNGHPPEVDDVVTEKENEKEKQQRENRTKIETHR